MVVFTCNHCGESVKKPAVDKHYFTKCRGAPKNVSCMDCQKDFKDNYVEHTKCITELEKYSGKDYVPKESQNRGAKKQEGWVEVVRSVLDSKEYALNNETRKAFITLQNYDNIPRKKAKFLNFVTNSVHLPKKIVNEVWDILEKEQEKMKQARQAQQANTQKVKETETKEANEVTAAESLNGEATGEKKKKQKITVDSEEAINEKQNGCSEEIKKKKKKRKDIENGKEAAVENGLANGVAKAELEAGKKKKKKHEDTEAVEEGDPKNDVAKVELEEDKKKRKVKEIELGETNEQNGQVEGSKKQKKKHKAETDVTATEPPSKKQKKSEAVADVVSPVEAQPKKKKHNDTATAAEEPAKKKQKTAQSNGTTQENSEGGYRFCWDTELARIPVKYPEGVTLEKLQKKLLKKFKTKFTESELTERQEKGFEKKLNKKLQKSTTLKLEGELVKVVS